jgi:hypothetical protein
VAARQTDSALENSNTFSNPSFLRSEQSKIRNILRIYTSDFDTASCNGKLQRVAGRPNPQARATHRGFY